MSARRVIPSRVFMATPRSMTMSAAWLQANVAGKSVTKKANREIVVLRMGQFPQAGESRHHCIGLVNERWFAEHYPQAESHERLFHACEVTVWGQGPQECAHRKDSGFSKQKRRRNRRFWPENGPKSRVCRY